MLLSQSFHRLRTRSSCIHVPCNHRHHTDPHKYIPHTLAPDSVPKSIVMCCPAPVSRAGLGTGLVAVSANTATKRVAKPAVALVEGLSTTLTPSVCSLQIRTASASRCLREVGDVHNARSPQIASARSLGSLMAETADHAEGSG